MAHQHIFTNPVNVALAFHHIQQNQLANKHKTQQHSRPRPGNNKGKKSTKKTNTGK